MGRDSPADWLNSNATQFFPDWGKDVDLKPLYPRDAIRVEGAPADALRAMKLRTAMSRPGRDTDDIVSLVAELDIESANYAESIFSASHPGDALKDRVYALVERAVAHRAEFQTTALPDVELIQRHTDSTVPSDRAAHWQREDNRTHSNPPGPRKVRLVRFRPRHRPTPGRTGPGQVLTRRGVKADRVSKPGHNGQEACDCQIATLSHRYVNWSYWIFIECTQALFERCPLCQAGCESVRLSLEGSVGGNDDGVHGGGDPRDCA